MGPPTPSLGKICARLFAVLLFLYLFLVSINAMGAGLKTYARDAANQARLESLFDYATNPFVGLAAGILLTAVVQSSSFSTSFIITLVAAGELTTAQAVPAIMGANIGTSITNTLVSLAHWRRRREFRTAFSAAICHDIFNYLTVMVLLPLELIFGILSRPAGWAASVFDLPRDMEVGKGVVKMITQPIVNHARHLLVDELQLSSTAAGLALASAGVLLLFLALVLLVRMLKGLMLGKLEALFKRVFFSSTVLSLVVGIIVTIMVQSSSVTTSLIVPFVGARLLTLRQVFPYMVGANIGTTCTALLAAAAAHTAGALTVAFVHLLFNVLGASIFIPLRRLPINISRRLARIAAGNRLIAILYIAAMFFVLPIAFIYVFSLLS